MRIVFFGSAAFAVPTLEALLDDGHAVAAVVTRPDRRAGRGKEMHATAVKKTALARGLEILQPPSPDVPEVAALLERVAAEVAVVVAYGHLIPEHLLDLPTHGFVNLHASVLPKYRGAAPVPHALLAGETETGVTVFRLNERFDEGAILGVAREPVREDDTTGSLLARLAPLGARLVREVIGEMAAGWVQPVEQVDAEATRAPKLTKEMGRIDWSAPRAQIDRQVRAFQPWPLAYTFVPGAKGERRLNVLQVEPGATPRKPPPAGTVVVADDRAGLLVECGDGPLWLREVQPAGGRPMAGTAYVRGARLAPGGRLDPGGGGSSAEEVKNSP